MLTRRRNTWSGLIVDVFFLFLLSGLQQSNMCSTYLIFYDAIIPVPLVYTGIPHSNTGTIGTLSPIYTNTRYFLLVGKGFSSAGIVS